MKRTGRAIGIACIALLAGCAQSPTMYDRVDADMIRVLDFMYDPPEAKPGDSVTVTAVFAGREFDIDAIAWSVSYVVLANNYGGNASVDKRNLEYVATPYDFSPSTQAMKLRFKIPETVIAESPMIPENLEEIFPSEDRPELPEGFAFPTKSEILAILDSVAKKSDGWKAVLAANPDAEDSLRAHDPAYGSYELAAPLLPVLLQFMSAPIRIYADIEGTPRIQSDFTVRYNNAFAGLPAADVRANNNPVIDSIVIYEVNKAGLVWFDPATSAHDYSATLVYVGGDSRFGDIDAAVTVKKNRSYFIGGYASPPDSLHTIESAMKDMASPPAETYVAQWYFQLDSAEIEGVERKKYLNIVNVDQLIARILPAGDKQVKKVTIWLEIFDENLNEAWHPVASTLEEVSVWFSYTDDYLASVPDK